MKKLNKYGEWKKTGRKKCTVCLEDKVVSEFLPYRHKHYESLSAYCRPCGIKKSSSSRRKSPLRFARARRAALKGLFGLTVDAYDAMVATQGGVCGICKRPETRRRGMSKEVRRLSVDHCHKTGAVRSLLCSACNTAIGQMDESLPRLQAAMEYLRNHGATW